MNILFLVNDSYPISAGTGNLIWGFAKTLVDRGHKTAILTPRDLVVQQLAKTLAQVPLEEVHDNIQIYRFDFPRSGPFWIYRSLIRLFGSIARLPFSPDIIFGANFYLYGTGSALYGLWKGIPSMTCATGSDVDQVFGFHVKLLTWLSLKMNKCVCVTTMDQKEKLLRRVKRDYSIIFPAIESQASLTKQEAKKRLGFESHEVYFLGVGRFQSSRHGHIKGFNYLLEAMKELPAGKLNLIGTGPHFQTYLEFIQQNHLSERVHLLGELPKEKFWEYFIASDIFVLPSLHEGLSVALVEAMSLGLPVVATSVGGAKDHIRHGINGLLVPPEDSHALAKALKELLEDPNRREQMGAKSLETFLENFSVGVSGKRLEDLMQSLQVPTSGV